MEKVQVGAKQVAPSGKHQGEAGSFSEGRGPDPVVCHTSRSPKKLLLQIFAEDAGNPSFPRIFELRQW